MVFPSLLDIASKVVAQNFLNGVYDDANFQLPTVESNLVFKELRQNPFPSEKMAVVASERLNVTEANFCYEVMDMNDVRFLSKQNNLQVLKFGHWYNDYAINTALLLTDCVNEQSRGTIRHILFGEHSLTDSRLLNMVHQFPNVVSLAFPGAFTNNRDFAELCALFPSLTHLDLASCTKLTDIKGISKLFQLEVLSINEVDVQENAGLRELCQLKRLRVLNAGSIAFHRVFRCLSALVQEGVVPFPSLEELDCTSSEIDERMFRLIETWIPSLQLICLCDTPLNFVRLNPVNQNLTVLNCATTEVFLKTIQYYRRNNDVSLNVAVEVFNREVDDLLLGIRGNRNMISNLIRELDEVAMQLRYNEGLVIMGWQEAYAIIAVLCSPAFFDDLTRVEIHTIFSMYRTALRNPDKSGDIWEDREFHEYYWTCLSELCKRDILEVADLDEVVKNSVELLKNGNETEVLSLVSDFYGEVFKNPKYSKLYNDFLEALQSSVDLSEDFCKKYLEHQMFKAFYCKLNFHQSLEEAFRIRMAHMKILFRVFITVRESLDIFHFCDSIIVCSMLIIISCQPLVPFDSLGHYAFAILFMIIRRQSAYIHPNFTACFELAVLMKPLQERHVLELIRQHGDEELLWFARDYYIRFL